MKSARKAKSVEIADLDTLLMQVRKKRPERKVSEEHLAPPPSVEEEMKELEWRLCL